MKICSFHLTVWISLCLNTAFPFAIFARQPVIDQPMTTDTTILSSLRDEHPRLIALDEDVRSVAILFRSHPNGKHWEEQLRRAGELAVTAPPVEHVLIGPRLLSQSRAALERITLLSFLHRLKPDQRYVNRVALEMETACRFSDWNPSHFLDTAEMTAAMAIGYDWLYSDLTTKTRTIVREGIIRHGLAPGLKMYKSDTWWVKGRNNWNHVCNGGLMIGALAIADEDPEIATEILNYGKGSLATGMALFAPDGGWLEASAYWVYTMKYTTLVLSALHTSLGTAFGLDQSDGFENTGRFMLAMEGPTGKYFNWGDCGEKVGNLPELFWLARRFDQPDIAWLARQHMGEKPGVFDLLWYNDQQAAPGNSTPLDWYFDGIEAGSLREEWNNRNASFVAFKGGDNAAPHSNLDIGTFVFDSDGQRWALDLGSDDYNLPNYWNPVKRLAYYRIRTEGQNTLVLNGTNQNIDAISKIIRRTSTGSRAAFAIVDLSKAYQPVVSAAHRGFMLTGSSEANQDRRHLVVQDELEATEPISIQWFMHTAADVTVNGRTATMAQNGSSATLTLLEPESAILTLESAEQPEPQKSNKGITRITVAHKHPGGAVRIVIQLSPGSAAPFKYKAMRLEQWN